MFDSVTGLITQQATARNEAAARRETVAAETAARHEGFEHDRWRALFEAEQQELARRAAAADQRRAELERRALDHYPVPEGPGFLRDSLGLAAGPGRDDRLVVLIAPPLSEDASGEIAAGLRVRVADELPSFARGEVRSWLIQRPLQWPHYDLYVCDLYDVPALVLQLSVSHGRLTVRLGGCNLGLLRAEDSRPVYHMNWPRLDDWTDEAVRRLIGGDRIQWPVAPEALTELNSMLVARIVTVCLVAAIDAYHLTRREAYDELLDGALEAVGVVGDDWPVEASVDPALVVDPAYHLLHRVSRRLARADHAGAKDDLAGALAALAGIAADLQPIEDLARAAATGQGMREHHRRKALELLERFPKTRWRSSTRSALAARPEPAARALAPAHEAPSIRRPAGRGEQNMLTADDISRQKNAEPAGRRQGAQR